MKRAIFAVLILLLATGAFAEAKANTKETSQSWATSYNKDGQFNIYASLGWAWGFTASVCPEYIITEFEIGEIPFDFGVAVRGAIEFYDGAVLGASGLTGVYWGAAPLATLHLGLASIPLEFYISVGVAFYGWSWSADYIGSGYGGFNFGFATVEGVIWHFSDMFGLILEGGYLGGAGVWGIGVEIQL
jgi:hypothetical protein